MDSPWKQLETGAGMRGLKRPIQSADGGLGRAWEGPAVRWHTAGARAPCTLPQQVWRAAHGQGGTWLPGCPAGAGARGGLLRLALCGPRGRVPQLCSHLRPKGKSPLLLPQPPCPTLIRWGGRGRGHLTLGHDLRPQKAWGQMPFGPGGVHPGGLPGGGQSPGRQGTHILMIRVPIFTLTGYLL